MGFDPFMQATQQKNWQETVGVPKTPLPKLPRNSRSELKKNIGDLGIDIDAVMGIRITLSAGVPLPAKWRNAGLIDQALDTQDIVRHFERLTTSRKLIDAAPVLEVISRRVQNT